MDYALFVLLNAIAFLFLAFSVWKKEQLLLVATGIVFLLLGLVFLSENLTVTQPLAGLAYQTGSNCTNSLDANGSITGTNCTYANAVTAPNTTAINITPTNTGVKEGIVIIYLLIAAYLLISAVIFR